MADTPETSIHIGDTIQCIEDNWQGIVTAFDKYNDATMLVCHQELDDERWFDPRDVRLIRRGTFIANLIQFIRPSGRQRSVTTDLPIDVRPLYLDMLEHGCKLECEVLTTDEVSVTVSNGENDLDFSVTANWPDVQNGITELLRRQSWLKLKQEKEST